MKLDILAFAAHPDDVELSCSGTIAKEISLGKRVGIVDFTQGELGSRGSAALRAIEANASSELLRLSCRENLSMPDGFFEIKHENLLAVIQQIRRYQPEVVLANATSDRHPDHGRAASLVARACFLSGLIKVETNDKQGAKQKHWRPKALYHYIQDRYLKPDFVVDITGYMPTKMAAIKAFKSQFYDPGNPSGEVETPISNEAFLNFIEARAREFGRTINAEFGEGFIADRTPGVQSVFDLQ